MTTSFDEYLRQVPDFPKPGIQFLDFSPLLADPQVFSSAVEQMAAAVQELRPTKVVAIESRGFILGAPLSQKLDVGFVMVRKKGKLPGPNASVTYDLEYGQDCLEMYNQSVTAEDRVLIVDDVLATGGTAQATEKLCLQLGATVVGTSFLIEIDFLNGRQKLKSPVFSLLHK